MMAQIVAAALINECQVLAAPASCGNVPTSGGKEDHVSMGMTAALKLRTIVDNLERIVAIELMCAAQAIEFRLPLRSSSTIQRAQETIRSVVPQLQEDRSLAPEIEALATAVREGAFDPWCETSSIPAPRD
jgi:histidine ammonia-lyase